MRSPDIVNSDHARDVAESTVGPLLRASRSRIFSAGPLPEITVKRSRLRDLPPGPAPLQDSLDSPAVPSTEVAQARVHRVGASQAPQPLPAVTVSPEPVAPRPAVQHGLRAAKRALRKPQLIRAETIVPELPPEVIESLRRWDFFASWAQEEYGQLQARARELLRQIEEAKRTPIAPDFLTRRSS